MTTTAILTPTPVGTTLRILKSYWDFSSTPRDPETGPLDCGLRWPDPETGRWLSPSSLEKDIYFKTHGMHEKARPPMRIRIAPANCRTQRHTDFEINDSGGFPGAENIPATPGISETRELPRIPGAPDAPGMMACRLYLLYVGKRKSIKSLYRKKPRLTSALILGFLIGGCNGSGTHNHMEIEARVESMTEGRESIYVGNLGYVGDGFYLVKGDLCAIIKNDKYAYSGGTTGTILLLDESENSIKEHVHIDFNRKSIYVYVGKQFFHIINLNDDSAWKYPRIFEQSQ